MAKKKKNLYDSEEYSVERYNQGIEEQDITVYTKDHVILYGVNVSVFRAIGRLIDGLPPIKTRILYLMYKNEGLLPTKDHVKVPQWLHRVSMYHPHGTGSIDNTFNSMIKPWETNAPLIDVSGNKGSITGDAAASVRYLNARLSLYAYKCFFEEFDQDAVEMVPNYLKTELEPVWLPAKYPNFLLSVSTGIAWGNAMNYVAYNLIEAFELTKALIKNPNMDNVYLFPDSPRGYEVIDDGTAPKICGKGHGSFKIRAVLEVIDDKHGNPCIKVSGFPEGVSMDDTMRAIAVLVNEKAIFGIEDASDKANLNEVYYVLHLKKGIDPQYVIAQLYANKKTKLTGHCDFELNFAERTHILHLGLKDAILEWVERRIDYLQKYYIRKLNEYEKKAHEYAGILKIMTEKDFTRAAKIIHNSDNDDDMIASLIKAFGVTSYQAEVISNLSLRQNTRKRREELEKHVEEIPKKIDAIRDLIQSRKNLEQKICDDLDEGIKLFGKPRACKIISASKVSKTKQLEYRILVTQTMLKKMMAGSNAVGVVQDEVIGYYQSVTDDDRLLVVNDLGRLYNVPFTKVNIAEATQKGHSLLDVAGMGGVAVRSILIKPKEEKKVGNRLLTMFTKSGIIKTTKMSEFTRCRSDLQGIILDDNDKVCYATVTEPKSTTKRLIYTKKGMGLIIDLKTVAVTARMTKGTTHLSLNNDEICGVAESDCDEVCVITTKGYTKICALDDILTAKKKKADMIRLTSLVEGDEVFKILPAPIDFREGKLIIHMASGSKVEVEASEIRTSTRISKGFKTIPVKRGDSIVRVRFVE